MHHQERRQKCQNSHGAALSFIAICIALLMRNALDPFRLKNRASRLGAKLADLSRGKQMAGRLSLSLSVIGCVSGVVAVRVSRLCPSGGGCRGCVGLLGLQSYFEPSQHPQGAPSVAVWRRLVIA